MSGSWIKTFFAFSRCLSFPHHLLLTTSSVFSVFQTDFEKDVDMACRSGEHITGENQQVTWFGDWTRPFFFPFYFICVCRSGLHVRVWAALTLNPGQKKAAPLILPYAWLNLFPSSSLGLLAKVNPCSEVLYLTYGPCDTVQRRESRKKRLVASLPAVILLCCSKPCPKPASDSCVLRRCL